MPLSDSLKNSNISSQKCCQEIDGDRVVGSTHERAASDKPPLRVKSLQGNFDKTSWAWRGVLHEKCKIHPSYLKKKKEPHSSPI